MKKLLLINIALLSSILHIKAQWAPLTTNGFNQPVNNESVSCLIKFKGKLYAGVGGSTSGPSADTAKLYVSSTGNSNDWAPAFTSPSDAASGPYMSMFTAVLENNGVLYVGGKTSNQKSKVFKTTDGINFTSCFESQSTVSHINVFKGTSSADSIFVFKEGLMGYELWKSSLNNTDSINGWIKATKFAAGNYYAIVTAVTIHNNILYVATSSGTSGNALYKSTDGINFSVAVLNANISGGASGLPFSALGFNNQNVLFAGTKSDQTKNTTYLLSSSNGGATWNTVYTYPGHDEMATIKGLNNELWFTLTGRYGSTNTISIKRAIVSVNSVYDGNFGTPDNKGLYGCLEYFENAIYFGFENSKSGGRLYRQDICPLTVLVKDPIAGNINSGTVVIYKDSSKTATIRLDTAAYTSANTNGYYTFNAVDSGSYWIKFYPDTLTHPNLIPTYYGDKFQWDLVKTAHIVAHFCTLPKDTFGINVINKQPPLPLGTGKLRGRVVEGLGYHRSPTDPIPGADVKVGRKPPGGNIAATTTTDTIIPLVPLSGGWFEFGNLPYNIPGEKYVIYIDIPGYGLDSAREVVLDSLNPQQLQLNYYVDSNTIWMDSTIYPTGIVSNSYYNENKLSAYPNPTKNNANINYALNSEAYVRLTVFNILGMEIETLVNTKQAQGNYKLLLHTDEKYASGIYFIQLTVDDRRNITKLVIEK